MATGVRIARVQGFDQLSPPAQEFFRRTAARHRAAVGRDYKDGVTPVRVEEYRDHLRVWLRNGDWLRYLPGGVWG